MGCTSNAGVDQPTMKKGAPKPNKLFPKYELKGEWDPAAKAAFEMMRDGYDMMFPNN